LGKTHKKTILERAAIEAYINRLIELCWLMSTQDPPMVLCFDGKKGDPFNKDLFSEYSTGGGKFSYLVWPAVFLCGTGSLMKKGVAQAKGITSRQPPQPAKPPTIKRYNSLAW